MENHFFQSLAMFVLQKNNNCQGWSCKRKVPKKKLRRKNPTGGGSAPPGQLGLRQIINLSFVEVDEV